MCCIYRIVACTFYHSIVSTVHIHVQYMFVVCTTKINVLCVSHCNDVCVLVVFVLVFSTAAGPADVLSGGLSPW